MSTSELFRLNKLENEKENIKPDPLFQDTFICKVGEHRCPVKGKNTKLEHQLSIKDNEILKLTEDNDNLKDKLENEVREKLGDKELKNLLKDVKLAPIIEEKNQAIRNLESNIESKNSEIEKLSTKISELEKREEKLAEEFFDANTKDKEKYQTYIKLLDKIEFITSQINHLRKQELELRNSISQKSKFEKMLCERINLTIENVEIMEENLAKLQASQVKLEKSKPSNFNGKKGFFTKIKSSLKWSKPTSKPRI